MEQDWIVRIVYVVLAVPLLIAALCVCLSDGAIYGKVKWLAFTLFILAGSSLVAGFGLKESLLVSGVWCVSIAVAVMVVRVLQYLIDGPARRRES